MVLSEKIRTMVELKQLMLLLAEEIEKETEGEIVFHTHDMAPDLGLYHGVRKVAELLGGEVERKARNSSEYPYEERVMVDGCRIYELLHESGVDR